MDLTFTKQVFFFKVVWVYGNWPICRSPILIKLYTFVVYNLRMCMKEYNPGTNIFQGR